LEATILDLCRERGPKAFQRVVIALADCEASIASNAKWREESYLRPIHFPSDQWLTNCDDGSAEFRLAASLAGLYSKGIGGFRQYLEQVNVAGRWPEWSKDLSAHADVVWSEGSLVDNLLAVLARRTVQGAREGKQSGGDTLVFPGPSRVNASLGDVGLFLQDLTEDDKIGSLARGLSLLDWRQVESADGLQPGGSVPTPDATFALLKLCYTPHVVGETHVPLEPAIAKLAAAGRIAEATRRAARRLLGSGLPPAFTAAARSGKSGRRIAAALLFPLGWQDIQSLAEGVLRRKRAEQSV
jgi:CRISPR-associated protein Csx17